MKTDNGYSVVFLGELVEGVSADEAKRLMRARFSLENAHLDKLLASRRVVMKRGLDRETAGKFRKLLFISGLVTEVEAEVPPPDTGSGVVARKRASESGAVRRDPTFESDPGISGEGRESYIAAPSGSGGDATVLLPPGASAPEQHGIRELPFRFSGNTGEFFRIWIVNALLTVLTLGIYSAWAKVRTNRYFYANTWVDESSFEYLANPVAILKGRILVVAVLLLYIFTTEFYPPAEPGLLLILFLASPWIIVRALRFRNRNTAYRNIRFGFDGNYGDAIAAFVGWPIVGGMTLGLLYPHAIHKQKQFVVSNSRYGAENFDFDARTMQFFKILFLAGLFIAVGAILSVVTQTSMLEELSQIQDPEAVPPEVMMRIAVGSMLTGMVFMVVYFLAYAYYTASMGNLVLNSSNLDDHRFESTLSPLRLGGIILSNWLVTIITLGLARPWAMIRLARYRAANLTLYATNALDGFVADQQQQSNAVGEELGDAFDVDFGL
jgi:uncharacterized membrane protein YjgN (DUF898 family)